MDDPIGTVFGLAIFIVIGIPVLLAVLTVAVSTLALQVALVVAAVGYIIGIPWSIWFRLRHGYWPQA